MNANLDFYKETGKWYASQQIDIPDTIKQYDSTELYMFSCENQTAVSHPYTFYISYECDLFKKLFIPQQWT